jgi:hypothetical protein
MRPAALSLLLTAIFATPALAQQPRPIPALVIDARGVLAGLGHDAGTAGDLGIAAIALPGRGLGGVVGVHMYPIRRPAFAIGVGGEALFARGSSQPTDGAGAASGPKIGRRLQGFTGALSLNFGHRDGWSYVSAGIGPMQFETFAGDRPANPPAAQLTLHYGGGARWFTSDHLAAMFDFRFYLTRLQARTETFPGRGRERLVVLSVGIAIK